MGSFRAVWLVSVVHGQNSGTSLPMRAGRVDSLVRRDVNVDMNNNTEQQYAFIRYRNRQDARYAVAAGEINFYGRKL